jgi:hypothetical protein
VLAIARRERRILLTHDRGFLDDRTFSETPAIVVLPVRNHHSLTKALVYALSLVGRSEGAKVIVHENGRFAVTRRNADTGEHETAYYKLRKDGPPLIWASGKSS